MQRKIKPVNFEVEMRSLSLNGSVEMFDVIFNCTNSMQMRSNQECVRLYAWHCALTDDDNTNNNKINDDGGMASHLKQLQQQFMFTIIKNRNVEIFINLRAHRMCFGSRVKW